MFQSFYVAEISESCILGLDFLQQQCCQLNIEDGLLSMGDLQVPLLHTSMDDLDMSCYRVLAVEDVNIQPRTEAIIPAKVINYTGKNRWGIIEPADDEPIPGLVIGKVLTKLTNETTVVPVRIVNVTDEKRKVVGGTNLAKCEAVNFVVCPDFENTSGESRPSKEIPNHLAGLYESSAKDLVNEDQRDEVRSLLCENAALFSTDSSDLGRTDIVKHQIKTGSTKPIKQPPRRLPLAKRDAACQAVNEMLRNRVIEPSTSPWSSPVVLVAKKNGDLRFCVDYRKLNDATVKDSYPLPRIDDTLDALGGSQWFSTLDLKSGYWQVAMDPKDKEKTAFSIGGGLWHFRVMPFGLCNAPATFERLMDHVLAGLPWNVCLVYLDDIIVHGRTFSEQLENLQKVFACLKKANLKLSPEKCNLFRREVKYLGHIISCNGVATDPSKIDSVKDWPRPTCLAEMRSFLGLCSYYRKFIRNFAEIADPLTRLTQKNVQFLWDSDTENAFQQLKCLLTTTPVLSFMSDEGALILDTDASGIAIGAVLSQKQDNEEKVIAYFSRSLDRTQRQYCATRRELLAVVKSLAHFHPYLYGRTFVVRTDHSSLRWLMNFKHTEGQLARWLQKIQQYDLHIEHRPGKHHLNADALSRRPCLREHCKICDRAESKERATREVGCEDEDHRLSLIANRVRTHSLAEDTIIDHLEDENFIENLGPQDIVKAQEMDVDISPVIKWMKSGKGRPQWSEVSALSEVTKNCWAQWDSLCLRDNILCRKWESSDGATTRLQLLLPKGLREEVLLHLHNHPTGGHFGVKKTLERVKEKFYWPRCREDVTLWCSTCAECSSRKGPVTRQKARLGKYVVGAPLERVAVDVMGPLVRSTKGNRYLLVVMDYFSKWPEAYALPNQEAKTVATVIVNEFVCRFGVPLELHSDQGTNFESAVFQEMCLLLGIKKTRTTPLHPESDGMVERYNRTLKTQLSLFVAEHQKDWDKYVPLLLMAYRTAVHASTHFTPARLMMGREIRTPIDLVYERPDPEIVDSYTSYVQELQENMQVTHEFARKYLQQSFESMRKRYDVDSSASVFSEGDQVWLYNPRKKKGRSVKLMRPWEGPYVVIKRLNDLVYRIQRGRSGKLRVVHRNRLWAYRGEQSEFSDSGMNS